MEIRAWHGSRLAALVLLLIAPVFLAFGLSDVGPAGSPHQTLGAFGIVLAVFFTTGQVVLLAAYGRKYERMAHVRWADRTQFVLIALSASIWSVALLSSVALLYADRIDPLSLSSTGDVVSVRDVIAKFFWVGAKTIPLLDVADTVGWEDPIPKPVLMLGVLLLVFRMVLIIVIVHFAARVWNRRKKSVGR